MSINSLSPRQKTWGWIALVLWAVLIIAGIVVKRVFGIPDWMTFFHLPAAVALVWAFRILSYDIRAKYVEEMRMRMKRR